MFAKPTRSLILATALLSLSLTVGQVRAAEPMQAVQAVQSAVSTAVSNTFSNLVQPFQGEEKPSAAPVAAETADTPPASNFSQISSRASAILAKLGGYTQNAQEIIKSGFAYLGVEYKRGGTSAETGFDCSGLVRKVFDDAFGVELPHNAKAIAKEGAKVSVRDLKPGDLVFFNTMRRTFSHVGIYVGNHMFVHAPSSGGGVRVEDMRERYWVKRFNGARRISIE